MHKTEAVKCISQPVSSPLPQEEDISLLQHFEAPLLCFKESGNVPMRGRRTGTSCSPSSTSLRCPQDCCARTVAAARARWESGTRAACG
eukprot:5943753-Pleurochrysis_carterae.AAC.1